MDIQKIFKKAEAAYTASLRAIEKNINSEKEKIITWDAEISDLRKKYDECLLSDAPEEAQTIEIRIKQLKAKIQQSKRLIELNKKTLEDRNPVEAKKLIDLGRELLKNDPFEAEFKPVQAAIKNLIGERYGLLQRTAEIVQKFIGSVLGSWLRSAGLMKFQNFRNLMDIHQR